MEMRPAQPVATILYLDDASGEWLLRPLYVLDINSLPNCCYIFLPVQHYPYEESDQLPLIRHFGAPDMLATRMYNNINGYAGCRSTYDEKDQLTAYSTWFRCLVKMLFREPLPDGKDYRWYEMTYLSIWQNCGRRQILCIDTPDYFASRIQLLLGGKPLLSPQDPFAMHSPLLDEIVGVYDTAAWSLRDPIRMIEKSRITAGMHYEQMHDIRRHSIHSSEVLLVTIQTFESLLEQKLKTCARATMDLSKNDREQTEEYMKFQIQTLKSLRERSVSTHERLTGEISIAYNRIVSRDSRIMKSIAVLTMIFLPATFISAFFSTTFFTYGDEKPRVSAHLWLYWAIIIPFTLVIPVVWWYSLEWISHRRR